MENLIFDRYLAQAKELADTYGQTIKAQMVMNLHEMNLEDSGKLLRSIKFKTQKKQGVVDRIEFSYEFYGKIWETGAQNVFGKGVTLVPRHWREEAIELIKPELDQKFGELYASMIINEIFIDSVNLKF
jgi:hypothetical protein